MADRRRDQAASMTFEASPSRNIFGRKRQVDIEVVTGQGEGVPINLNVDNGSYRITPYSDALGVETYDVRCFVCGVEGRKKNLDTFRDVAEVVYALSPLEIDVDGKSPGLILSAASTVKVCVVKLG